MIDARGAVWLALAIVLGVAAPASAQDTLRFDFGPPVPAPDSAGEARCDAVALRRLRGGRVLWVRPLPERARRAIGGVCRCTTPDGRPCATEVRDYLRGRAPSPPGVIGLEHHAGHVFLADTSGLLVLDAASGAVVLDEPTPEGRAAWFDRGRWTLGACRGTARSGAFLGRCDDGVVFFDAGHALLVATRPARVVARATLSVDARRPGSVSIEGPLGAHTLRVEGAIFLR
ncbi:MAG: hypothetical protein KF729_22345 [Sandaracinaceae bacterium]|nr:hypothetical protein [Sandaracinaceae bacterium]